MTGIGCDYFDGYSCVCMTECPRKKDKKSKKAYWKDTYAPSKKFSFACEPYVTCSHCNSSYKRIIAKNYKYCPECGVRVAEVFTK